MSQWTAQNDTELRMMLSKGARQEEIAKRIGVSQQVVSYHVTKLRRRYGLQ
jgi:DNA-binding CsgD family transcriptional regulator